MQLARSGALVLSGIVLLVTTASSVQAQKKSRDLITREEIEASPKKDGYIYDLIRSIRPHMVEAPRGVRRTGIDAASAPGAVRSVGQGGSNAMEVAVFVDGNHAGGIDILKSIAALNVDEVRYFDPGKAVDEFGVTLGAGGAVVIKTHKSGQPD